MSESPDLVSSPLAHETCRNGFPDVRSRVSSIPGIVIGEHDRWLAVLSGTRDRSATHLVAAEIGEVWRKKKIWGGPNLSTGYSA